MAELTSAEFLLVYRFRPRRLFVLRLLFCVVVLAGAAVLSALLPETIAGRALAAQDEITDVGADAERDGI